MERLTLTPRPHWEMSVRRVGFTSPTINGETYWDESACYEFTKDQIQHLEAVTLELESLCFKLVQHVIEEKLYDRLKIPEQAIPLIEASWRLRHKNLYGRFDFSYDGISEPKLLEYNADTPTILLEASLAQRQWKDEVFPEAQQYNSIHEKLLETWGNFGLSSNLVHFCCLGDHEEERMTVEYLRRTANEALFETAYHDIRDIGWNESTFLDLDDREIETLFKLYPWEWIMDEDFGANIMQSKTQFIEPAWKMILSNKGILALLWELYPDHPNLLPAYFDPAFIDGDVVRKPLLSRHGANITVIGQDLATEGPYGAEGYIFQQYHRLPHFDGNYPVIGSWVIASQPAGIGILEDKTPITGETSRFIPHYFV